MKCLIVFKWIVIYSNYWVMDCFKTLILEFLKIIFWLLVTITPFLLIPIWVIPNAYSPMIRNFLWLSMLTTVILMTLAALTGNVYWYYDNNCQKWRWFYHCGKGPQGHYWGNTLFRNQKIFRPFAKKVRKSNISLNIWRLSTKQSYNMISLNIQFIVSTNNHLMSLIDFQ